MAHVAVTLEFENRSKDLALPLDVTVRLLIEGLTESLHLRQTRGQRYTLSIRTNQGLRPIPPNATLADANVVHGMVLMLLLEEQKPSDRTPQTNAYLQAENGHQFPLADKVNIIGRNDPKSGIFVDVDLKGLVTDPRIVSRRHAQVELEGERFYITDLTSTNGTKLNGKRLVPKEKTPLWDGDTIEVGRHGVLLKFTSNSGI
jgi:uncharacterized ubiquitin-like protein YukD